jgi:hypothetical protein
MPAGGAGLPCQYDPHPLASLNERGWGLPTEIHAAYV